MPASTGFTVDVIFLDSFKMFTMVGCVEYIHDIHRMFPEVSIYYYMLSEGKIIIINVVFCSEYLTMNNVKYSQ